MENVDVTVIGGGIIGLASAYYLVKHYPGKEVVILEKEAQLAHHQSRHNSGVLHSGIYYTPGSQKARNCREGKKAMEAFCEAEGIDYEICGKVIVAVSADELPVLERIYRRGQANGVTCSIIDSEQLKELEPYAQGIKAIQVSETGIVNYRQVCMRLSERIEEAGGRIVTNALVDGITRIGNRMVVQTEAGTFEARQVVNCAGLHSDRVAALSGQKPEVRIVPFRGEYYKLTPSAHHLCNNLIYPVPDPNFPFLGVHFTRTINGSIECGPNAVLAFAREGYRTFDVNLLDMAETLTYPGFVKLALKYWKPGLEEMWRSVSKAAFVKALRRLLPDIQPDDLESAPAGVRAQAVAPDGKMVDDFMIQQTDWVTNVCNAPSPAATASLNIGRLIVENMASRLRG